MGESFELREFIGNDNCNEHSIADSEHERVHSGVLRTVRVDVTS
jgi:hypothetical protein